MVNIKFIFSPLKTNSWIFINILSGLFALCKIYKNWLKKYKLYVYQYNYHIYCLLGFKYLGNCLVRVKVYFKIYFFKPMLFRSKISNYYLFFKMDVVDLLGVQKLYVEVISSRLMRIKVLKG